MTNSVPRHPRCAIYTRKSSEEGLEQAFNSLDAQREACAAYIKSQAGARWQPVRARYDDGGLSGGTLERPALQNLLDDIKAHRIDVVVVYKVDRLTRSLADFARIVDVFDTHDVSFVSVTQQFNTTTSMGRLTLNMLLSFAQFEREVTGERIRDKIAASKKKGMWMGGFVPLGYDAVDRTLVINESEAETVRTLFHLYLRYENVRRVKQEADARGLRTKLRRSRRGTTRGGRPLSRGYIYRLLNNPLYTGRIAHKDETYAGRHPAIIDPETWQAVQVKLTENAGERRSGNRAASPSLLAGLIFDGGGKRLTPSHALKSGRRYRYYVSPPDDDDDDAHDTCPFRIPAHEIEALVIASFTDLLLNRARLFDALNSPHPSPATLDRAFARARRIAEALQIEPGPDERSALRECLNCVTVRETEVHIAFSKAALRKCIGFDTPRDNLNADTDDPETFLINVPARLKRSGRAQRLIVADGQLKVRGSPDAAMIKLIARAHAWFNALSSGEATSAAEIAIKDGLTRSYVTRVIRLAFLAPDITEAILNGRQPLDLSAERLVRQSKLPLAWEDQRRILGFASPYDGKKAG